MNNPMLSAARSALSRLCWALALACVSLPACGEEAPVDSSDPSQDPLPLSAPAESDDEPVGAAAESPSEAPEEPLPTLQAELAVWPLELEAFEVVEAAFEGQTLLVAVAAADGVSLVRFRREPGHTAPQEVERRHLAGPGTDVRLQTLGARRLALWLDDGHLRALSLAPDKPLTGPAVTTLAAQEGGAFAPPLAVAEKDGALLTCLVDGGTPLCIAFDETLALDGLYPLDRRQGQRVVFVAPAAEGFLAVSATCAAAGCSRPSYDVLTIAPAKGPVGRARGLPDLDGGRDTAFVPTSEGFVLIGRRRGAGQHSAWSVTPRGTTELDGRFSRVIGGFTFEDETLLVERGHLRMRDGFPVTGIDLRALTFERRKALRHEKKAAERERFPPEVASLLPTEVDQTFGAHGEALVFSSPRVKGKLRSAIVRLGAARGAPGGT